MSTLRSSDVLIVGGFGHVGLPLGIVLADSGMQVSLYDTDRSKDAIIQDGRMPFLEHDAGPILKRVIDRSLHIARSLEDVARAKIVLITIGTPMDEYMNPRMEVMTRLADQIGPYLNNEHRLILRSTVYPGTSKCFVDLLERRGRKVHLAFCPERIVQGFAVRELKSLPQIVSGFTEPAVVAAESIFERLGVETIRLAVVEAELAKLFNNAWRYIQFATTNQFYMMTAELGGDYARIHHAMTHHYDRAADFPGAGFAAGPCLLKDTMQLAARFGNRFPLGHAAMTANEGFPQFVVSRLLLESNGTLATQRVGILGMAFKADTDDTRDSLSYKLAKILRFHGAEVVCSDEYVQDSSFVTKERLIATCPTVILGVPHTAYRGLVLPKGTRVVDLWGITDPRSTAARPDVRTVASASGASEGNGPASRPRARNSRGGKSR